MYKEDQSVMQETPLHALHVESGARMVDFSGWHMPVQYEGILAEHHATRRTVTVFDTCHMGRYLIEGANALDALSRIITSDLSKLADGRCQYGFMLNEQAGVLDDLITYRLASDRYLVVANAGTREKDIAWLRSHLPANVMFTNLSASMSKIDVQGPASAVALSRLAGRDLSGLRYFSFTKFRWQGIEMIASRSGYTGEIGFELYPPTTAVAELWRALLKEGVKPAGLGARDTLRLEAGLPLYGHEMTETTTPADAGYLRYAMKAADFIGKKALQEQIGSGPSKCLIGFKVTGRQSARNGNTVLYDGKPAGTVTSGSFAPTLDCSIGMAYLDSSFAAKRLPFVIDTGRARLEAEETTVPFYKRPVR
jgi:aminomethyltransferase